MTRLRRHRASLVVLAALVLAIAVAAATAGPGGTGARLDPDNPDPAGARAVARVLADQGVSVDVARGADALEAAGPDADTTVVVTSTELLGRSTIRRLRSAAGSATLVMVEPGPGTTRALGITAPPYRVTLDRPRAGDCPDPAYDDLDLVVDEAVAYPVPTGCFTGPDGMLLAEPRPGLVLLGAGDVLSNDQVLRADNAAVALRLLGEHDRLVWYVPDLGDLVAGDGVSLATLLPDWLRPALLLGLLTLLALVLWRARRLGALATEPLPVVVRAVETTRGRGRLYRRTGDRGHAVAVLRAAARDRAADLLRLGPHPDAGTLVRELARRTGRPVEEIAPLLAPDAPVPTTDRDLITLAGALAELDREVRRP